MSLKEKLSTPKGRLAAALSALLISWIFLFFYFVGPVGSIFPTEEMIRQSREELKKLQKENVSLKQREKEFLSLEKSYQALKERSWKGENGSLETDFRAAVQAAAKESSLDLNSLGTVKTTKINNELYFAEIDFQGTAPIDVIAEFLSKVRGIKPSVSWKRFDLRRGMGFQRTANTANLSAISSDPLTMNGTLRVICCGTQGDEK